MAEPGTVIGRRGQIEGLRLQGVAPLTDLHGGFVDKRAFQHVDPVDLGCGDVRQPDRVKSPGAAKAADRVPLSRGERSAGDGDGDGVPGANDSQMLERIREIGVQVPQGLVEGGQHLDGASGREVEAQGYG